MKRFVLIASLCLLTLTLDAEEWLLDGGSSVFIPQGWSVHSREDQNRISFANPDQSIIFQVSRYPGNSYDSDARMADDHLQALETEQADFSHFSFNGDSCSLGDIIFNSGDIKIRGWFLFLDREDWDYYLTVITGVDHYEAALPSILSCLDGFSPDEEGRRKQGAIGALLASGDQNLVDRPQRIAGTNYSFSWSKGREEASRLLIEREASILSSYTTPEEFDTAWHRYYQMIVRDAGHDLESLGKDLAEVFAPKSDREKAETLLAWLQSFEYGSTERFSDLLSPIETLASRTGDCDALALVYLILLRNMGIDGVLMVSRDYAHALAAVAVEGGGAGFDYNGRRYVVAEMTKKVALGMIAAEQADLSKWVIIPFNEYSKGNLLFGE